MSLRIGHVQPMSLDLFGHDDRELGHTVRYSVWNLAAAQARAGDRPTLHLLTSGRGFELEVAGVRTRFHRAFQLPRSAPFQYRFARQFSRSMLRSLRQSDLDLVHFHGVDQFHPAYALVAARCARQRVPLFAQERGLRPVGRLERAARNWALLRTTAVLAHSPESVPRYLSLGVPSADVTFVPNGFDSATFSPQGRREYDGTSPLRVLWVARMVESKGPIAMVDGVAGYAGNGARAEVTLVSHGPLKDAIEARLAHHGIPHQFLGELAQGALAACYREADVLVLPQQDVGSNQVVIEALACGLPVVASDVSGIREAVGGGGVLVPPGDGESVAAALRRVASVESWRRLSANAVAHSAGYTWDAVAALIRAVYADHGFPTATQEAK